MVATQAIFAARWRRDNFKKIASPSQAKNRSCSRGLNAMVNFFNNLVVVMFASRMINKPNCLLSLGFCQFLSV